MNLEELQEKFKGLKAINEKQEKRVRYHETRAQNLTIAYVVLQALFFVGIVRFGSSSSSSQWWVPFSMVLISCIIFFMAFIDAVSMFYRTQYQLDINYIQQELIFKKIHEAKHSATAAAAKTSKSHFVQIMEQKLPSDHDDQHEILTPDVVQLLKRKVYIYFTTLALLAFTVIQLYACRLFFVG